MDDFADVETNALGLTIEIVGAFVSNNSLPASELPALITSVYAAVTVIGDGGAAGSATAELETAATTAQIKKSITPDALISFIDGKPYKTLKRHLSTHGLDFVGYRARYGLPPDYPAVAPSYSAMRSSLAKSFGLGSNRGKGGGSIAEPAIERPKRARLARTTA